MIDLTRAYGLTFSIPANDVGISLCLRNSGEFARVESDLIIDYMRAAGGGTYLDVGGNIGAIALPVAAASAANRVIAVEAQRFLASLLATNAVQNNLTNMSVIHAAAGAKPGLMAFPQITANHAGRDMNYGVVGVGVKGTERLPTENVRACTLDEIGPDDTRFVKIDVEGFESAVLSGSPTLISRVRPSWLIEANVHTPEKTRACMNVFFAQNYRLYWFYAPFVTPRAPKFPRAKTSGSGDRNFLAVPAEIDSNPWGLRVIDPEAIDFNVSRDAYEYLKRYGFTWQDQGPT